MKVLDLQWEHILFFFSVFWISRKVCTWKMKIDIINTFQYTAHSLSDKKIVFFAKFIKVFVRVRCDYKGIYKTIPERLETSVAIWSSSLYDFTTKHLLFERIIWSKIYFAFILQEAYTHLKKKKTIKDLTKQTAVSYLFAISTKQ